MTTSILTSPSKAEQSRQRTEDQLSLLFSKAMRRYLARLEKALRSRVNAGHLVLTAAGEPVDPITLGLLYGWWSEAVDEETLRAVLDAFRRVYTEAGVPVPESAVTAAVEVYLPRVRDRLVRGIVPPIAEDSFERARVLLARSVAEGWTRQRTAARIALEFGWETDGPALREELDRINTEIDALLDPLGHPGSPAREYARLHDPHIADLQADRAELIKQLDAEQSYWRTRAERISRTESTAIHGYAADQALAAEGFTHKRWLATEDARTRVEHRDADGQTVPVDSDFLIGGYTARFPADPSLPPHLSVNCRCTIVGVDRQNPQ